MSLTFSHPIRRKSSAFGRLINVIESKSISDKLILRILFFTIIGGLLAIALIANDKFLAETPTNGGTLIEGVVGIPRFVNPVLAVTRADQDMVALIYSGLMKIDPAGTLIPDLAESVTISEDGKTYNVLMRTDARFHDDTPLTARDVAFTIGLIQNPDLKSPLRGNWSGVTIEELGEYELNIILDEAYTPFIENFTVGILPRHIWSELPVEQLPFSQRNTEPVGSGPFQIDSIVRNDSGLIDVYKLTRADVHLPNSKLAAVNIRFYQNEETLIAAFYKKEISSTTNLPTSEVIQLQGDSNYQVIEEPLPRVFAIFFNQNRSPAIRDLAVRKALAAAIDREEIINKALGGFGVPIHTSIPQADGTLNSTGQSTGTAEISSSTDATLILTNAGWNKNQTGTWEKKIDGDMTTLSITLRTANTPLFEQTTQTIAEAWREIGVEVQIEQFEQSDLLQAVIRPRDFQGLLFGIDMSRAVDLYPFWHSSQREDPGLNIAQYANIEVDALLRNARTTKDTEVRAEAITKITDIITDEVPAIFLFVPTMTYILDSKITTAEITNISKPQERFMNIEAWHMNSDQLWPIFR